MFLEESILPVHMRAVEESIPVDAFLTVVLPKIVKIVILVVLDVELVGLDVPALLLWFRRRHGHLSGSSIRLESKHTIIALDLLGILILPLVLDPLLIVKGRLQPTQFVIQVDKDICS